MMGHGRHQASRLRKSGQKRMDAADSRGNIRTRCEGCSVKCPTVPVQSVSVMREKTGALPGVGHVGGPDRGMPGGPQDKKAQASGKTGETQLGAGWAHRVPLPPGLRACAAWGSTEWGRRHGANFLNDFCQFCASKIISK